MRISLLFISLVFLMPLFSQNNEDEKLAAQYFSEKQYDKAADIYEDLLRKQSESMYYYENLMQCYVALKDFKSAEKLVDKRFKKYPFNYSYQVDKAYLYQLQNNSAEKDKVLNDLLNVKFNSIEITDNIANGLIKRKFFDAAIQVYIKARKQLNQGQLYVFELSELYFYKGALKEASVELVSLLSDNEFILQEVKNKFAIAFKNEEDYDILIQVVMTDLQKTPNLLTLNDVLIWAYIQKKDWNGAFIQSKAVDKRLKEEGLWVMNLASVLMQNEIYTEAINCYTYIKSLGLEKRYFSQAQQGILYCGMLQLKQEQVVEKERLLLLENEFIEYINLNGKNWHTAQQMKDLAELYIYHLHDLSMGIDYLKQVLVLPGVNTRLLSESKLGLGDAYLMSGDTWEADLMYKQVEKAFQNDVLGQEAKFRYARLCYFRGEFEWAQVQLDVLKEATTQLISNNAMRLWLIIQDNVGLDSTDEAMKLYSNAELLMFQNKFNNALKQLDEISIVFPNHTLADEILFLKGVIKEKLGLYKEAEAIYSTLIKDFSTDILSDNALINLAKLYEFKLQDTAKAKQMYEFLIMNYTGSIYINEARLRFRYLRGDIKNEKIDNYWD